jgi:hypothetical protein
MNLYLLRGKFDEGVKLIPGIEKGLKDFSGKIDQESEILFYYNIAYIFFGAGKYEKSLDWINRILNKKDIKLREDIQVYSRLLNLFVHYELGNFDLLEYEIKSTRRFLDSHNYLNESEKAILSFLNKLINQDTAELRGELFNDLKFRMAKRSKETNKILEYFDIISWLDSKIEVKSFAAKVEEKASVNIKK